MYNYFQIIGRLLTEPELHELGEGKKVVNVLLGVNRPFKNMDGEYSMDTLKISLWDFLADYANDTFKKGRMVSIKGRIAPIEVEIAEGKKAIYHNLVGERILFYEYGSPKEFPVIDSTEEES